MGRGGAGASPSSSTVRIPSVQALSDGTGLPGQAVSERRIARSNAKAAVQDCVGRVHLRRRAVSQACRPAMPSALRGRLEREIPGHQCQHGTWRRLDINALVPRLAVRRAQPRLCTVHMPCQLRRNACPLSFKHHRACRHNHVGSAHRVKRRGWAGIRADCELRIDQHPDQKAACDHQTMRIACRGQAQSFYRARIPM